MLRHLLPLISDHEIYIEAFGGGGSLLLNGPVSDIEIYNDLDQSVVNFFRVLRDHGPELVRRVELTPRSRVEWLEASGTYNDDDLSDIERARRFYVHVRQSWCGMRTHWAGAPSLTESRRHASELRNRGPQLLEVAARLNHVIIEWLDFRDLLPKYDVPGAFWYLDPPYVSATRVSCGEYGEFEMSNEDHVDLCNLARQLCGKVMLSGYDNEIYASLLGDWKVLRFNMATHVGKTDVKTRREECAWLNRRAAIGAGV